MVSLNIGCADTPFCEVRVDIRHNTKANVIADVCHLPFKPNVFGYIYASNVLEHLSIHPYDALNELGYVLKLNGVLHIVQPPGEGRCLFIECFALPFTVIHFIHIKKLKSAKAVLLHLWKFKRRHYEKTGTGYGGHRWYLPWGWKLYCRAFGFLGGLRWNGIYVLWEIFYVKNYVSSDGEEFGLRKLKEYELIPLPVKHVSYHWY